MGALLDHPRFSSILGLVGVAITVVGAITSPVVGVLVTLLVLIAAQQFYSAARGSKDRADRANLVIAQQTGVLYEVLRYEHVWDFVDPEGREVLHDKRMRARFLVNNVSVIHDHAWGEGDLFEDYACSPGLPVDRYITPAGENVVISLREPRHIGDIEDFTFHRRVVNGFLGASEYIEVTTVGRTHELAIDIIFPRDRPCKSAELTRRSTGETRPLNVASFTYHEGRQRFSFHDSNPQAFEGYTIRWTWADRAAPP